MYFPHIAVCVTEASPTSPARKLISRARATLSAARHTPDRLAHGSRRKTAIASLQTVRAGSVLFLCHGNVCRSPFAEHLFARESRLRLGGAFSARSAGFIGPNRGSPSEALAGSLRFGIDLSEHRSQLVTPDMVRRSALVVVMSSTQASAILRRSRSDAPPVLVLGDLDPLPIAKRTILDPWGGGPSVFDESYTRIARCVDALVTALRDR